MSAGVYDFTIEQGVPYTFQVQYQNPDGTPKNLTSWIVLGQVKEKVNDCVPLAELETEIINPIEGLITVTVTAETTRNIKIRGSKYNDFGSLVYDIKLWPVNNLNDVRRLLNGVIKVSPEVTKVIPTTGIRN